MKAMATVSKYVLSGTRLLAILAGLVTIAMMVHICSDVFQKFVFNRPMRGTIEIVSHYYMVLVVFLPLGYIDWLREAIRMDLFYNFFPRPLKFAATLLSMLVVSGAYLGITYIALNEAFGAAAINEVAMGSDRIVIWPGRFAMVAGLAVASLISLIQLGFFLIGFERESWFSDDLQAFQ